MNQTRKTTYTIFLSIFTAFIIGCKPGQKLADEPLISTDFYPAFPDVAGGKPPLNYPLDGKSLMSLFKGAQSLNRNALYWHSPACLQSYEGLRTDSRDTVFRTRPLSVIRKGEWKLLMFHEEWVLDGRRANIDKNMAIELYKLENDIGERHNLAKTETAKRDELLSQLIQWQKEIKALIPTQANVAYRKK